MEKINLFIKKAKFLDFLVLILILATAFKFFLSISNVYLSLEFDSQNLLTWKFAEISGLLPFRDVFYPYGLLNYFADTNIGLSIIKIFLILILFLYSFHIFKKIFYNNNLSYFYFVLFYLLIIFFVGLDSFSRYGVVVVFAITISLEFFKNKYLTIKKILFLGLLTGLIFSLLIDQGIYIFIITLLFILLNPIIKNGAYELINKNYYKKEISYLFIYFVGTFSGSIFLLVYLSFNGIAADFYYAMIETKDLFLFAKTPYLHSLKTIPSFFNFAVLFMTISFLSIRFILLKFKFDKSDYLLFGLVLSLLILLQKSIVRTIDHQLLFIGLIAIFIFIDKLLNSKYFRKLKFNYSFTFILSIILYLSLILFIMVNLPNTKYLGTLNKYHKTISILKNNSEINKYHSVLEKLGEDKAWNRMLYTYPSDPVFYILNNQKPPYYFTSYESSPLYAQNKVINYIKANKIEYVIYNLNKESIQDGVPNYIRTPILHEYILNNFISKEQVGDFLILHHQLIEEDFFKEEWNNLPTKFKKYLLNVNLKNIPKTEGFYKKNNLKLNENNIIIEESSIHEFNRILDKDVVDSNQKFIVISFKKESVIKEDFYLKIITKDKLSSEIYFDRCENENTCIINLSRIPVFYKNRILSKLISSSTQIKRIALYEISSSSYFW